MVLAQRVVQKLHDLEQSCFLVMGAHFFIRQPIFRQPFLEKGHIFWLQKVQGLGSAGICFLERTHFSVVESAPNYTIDTKTNKHGFATKTSGFQKLNSSPTCQCCSSIFPKSQRRSRSSRRRRCSSRQRHSKYSDKTNLRKRRCSSRRRHIKYSDKTNLAFLQDLGSKCEEYETLRGGIGQKLSTENLRTAKQTDEKNNRLCLRVDMAYNVCRFVFQRRDKLAKSGPILPANLFF